MGKNRAGKRKRLRAANDPHEEVPPCVVDLENPLSLEEEIALSVARQREGIEKLKKNKYFLSTKEKYGILKLRLAKPALRVIPRRPIDDPYYELNAPAPAAPVVELGPLTRTEELTTLQKAKVVDTYAKLGIEVPENIKDLL